MVSKDESDFAKQRSFKTGLKNTNRKTDGSTKSFAAKKNVKKKSEKNGVMLLKLTVKFSDDCKYSCPTASVNSASRANITKAPHTHKLSLPSPQCSTSLHLIPSDCQIHEQNTTLKNSHLGKHLPGKCPFFLTLTAAFHFFKSLLLFISPRGLIPTNFKWHNPGHVKEVRTIEWWGWFAWIQE